MDREEESKREQIRLENKKIRQLRLVVDLSIHQIRSGRLSLEEAYDLVERVRGFALRLFPGKEKAFDIIYRPRFYRAISSRYQTH
jgi:hypothetical protein